MTKSEELTSGQDNAPQERGRRYIVSSSHLVSEQAAELSEFEFGLIIAWNAFGRWVARCMAAAGMPDLSTLDILVLHSVFHRTRGKRLADICFVLNIEETHTVNYALKKLTRLGLVQRHRKGKDVLFEATEDGEACIRKYREVREACLVSTSASMGGADHRDLEKLAKNLRLLSGLYDQAARSATSL
ncbi:winged helix DNA-binding protein [Fodinicurvata fenggangensis]|uniref:winged helix DNA-binding protein n=1 Tax=Fodinicurvata fenggangensis TaxID=1121830 RepID=UPI00047DF761|nr:winged helix DNA-binding protein [Fodinicurvata fenggangensis]